jgi:hypothetical protein
MPRPDETFIVRVRDREGDAVVEQPRLARRIRVRDLTQVGPVIARWLTCAPQQDDPALDGPDSRSSTK